MSTWSQANGFFAISSTPTAHSLATRPVGCSRVHSEGGHRLRRDLQSSGETGYHSRGFEHRNILLMANSPARCKEHLPPRRSQGDSVLLSTIGLHQRFSSVSLSTVSNRHLKLGSCGSPPSSSRLAFMLPRAIPPYLYYPLAPPSHTLSYMWTTSYSPQAPPPP